VLASPALGSHALTRTLCAVIVAILVAAVFYAAWISILNFSRISV
jgi:hypothetical protein